VGAAVSGATIKPEDRPGWRPVKRNCHTCGWNKRSERTGYNYCMVGGNHDLYPLTIGWIEDEVVRTGTDMPSRDADGCPGWKPKPGGENTDATRLRWVHDEWTPAGRGRLVCSVCGEGVSVTEQHGHDPVSAIGECACGTFPAAEVYKMVENTDATRVAALADSATIRPDSATAATVKDSLTVGAGWRGNLPICRGPGGIQAKRLRALVRGVRR
jgi:hypothetical protein